MRNLLKKRPVSIGEGLIGEIVTLMIVTVFLLLHPHHPHQVLNTTIALYIILQYPIHGMNLRRRHLIYHAVIPHQVHPARRLLIVLMETAVAVLLHIVAAIDTNVAVYPNHLPVESPQSTNVLR